MTVSHQAVDQKQQLDEALRLIPATKLLDFYIEIIRQGNIDGVGWDLERTLAQSKRLRDVPALQGAWMEKLVSEWLHGLGLIWPDA